MYTVDPRAIKNKQSQLKDVRKLIEGLPEFPSQHQTRYESTSRFFANLALSLGIPVSDMSRYKRILLGEKQRDVGEYAAQFYTRVNTRYQTVRFLAEAVEGCSDISHLELTGLYLDGLKNRTRILRKLESLGIDTARPHLWEQAQRYRNSTETSAILKIRQVATDLEADRVKEDAALAEVVARHVAQEMAQAQRSRVPSASRVTLNAPSRSFSFARRRPTVAAMQEPLDEGAGQDESLYQDLGEEDLEVMDEIPDLTDANESTVRDLCSLCGYDPSPFHDGGTDGGGLRAGISLHRHGQASAGGACPIHRDSGGDRERRRESPSSHDHSSPDGEVVVSAGVPMH
eukprot:gene7617-9072_t